MDIALPSSKSFAHRYLIAAALSKEPCEVVIDGFPVTGFDAAPPLAWSDDVKATYDCLRAMLSASGEWRCRESATTLRLLTPIARARAWRGEFKLEGRLATRPQWPPHLWQTSGPNDCVAGEFLIPGDISSQFVSGLLMALPLTAGGIIKIDGRLASRPYVEMTLKVLAECGIRVNSSDQFDSFEVPGFQAYRPPRRIVVPEDANLREFYDLVFDRHPPIPQVVDASDIPDSIPLLAAKAASYEGVCTKFTNCQRLRQKESDRLLGVARMIKATIQRREGGREDLLVNGGKVLASSSVTTQHDHRMVLTAALLQATFCVPIRCDDVECIRKSFPSFLAPKTFLYGPPGSGKTTEGRRIAAETGRILVDLDELVESNAGCTIAEIFAAEGESGFRIREKRALFQAVTLPGAVIALGGGTLLDDKNAALVREQLALTHGEFRSLTAPADELWRRIAADHKRPLAADRAAFFLLLKSRTKHYQEISQRMLTRTLFF